MPRFIETILFKNNNMPLIKWHEQRFAQTQIATWGETIYPSLEKIIRSKEIDLDKDVSYKCRVLYDSKNTDIQFSVYQQRTINSLVLKNGNDIDYHLKYEDRQQLNALVKDLQQGEEVLIVRNNLLTETSFTNIALWNGTQWHTPKIPLLRGVQRSKLIEDKIIIEKNISIQQLSLYQKICLFNALVDWDNAWELNTNQIQVHAL